MPTPNGSDMLLKLDNSATATPSYVTVGGMRAKSIKMNTEIVDMTNDDSARWRELLTTAGARSITVSGSGVFNDLSSQKKVHEYWAAGVARKWQVIVPELGTFEGTFVTSDLEFSGDTNKEVPFSMTLQSAGAVTFTSL